MDTVADTPFRYSWIHSAFLIKEKQRRDRCAASELRSFRFGNHGIRALCFSYNSYRNYTIQNDTT